jgi:hypothetical protein
MLRGHISPDVVNTDSVIGFGMGLDVEQIMPAMQQIGVIMEDVNPQCEYLADAAQGAKASVQNMTMSAAMMSGMVPGFKGFSVAIYDAAVDMAQKVSSNPFNLSAWDALVLISSDQPEMLLQSAQMFPPLAGINIPADGSEISLRDPIEASTGMPTDVSAAQRGNHIALFQGQQARDVAQRVGAADAGKNGLMYFRVNLRKYMGLIYESMAMMMGTQGAVSEEDQQKFARFLELYPEGTGDFALDVTAAGIEGISYTTLSVRNQ